MKLTLLVLTLLIPMLFWAGYHYYKDRYRPEPLGNLALCFLFGVGSALLGKQAYSGLGMVGLRYDAMELAQTSPWRLFAYSLLAIGLIEETVKFLPFWLIALRFRKFDEPIDGIVYASFIALGFAGFENFHYLDYLTTGEAVARGFAGPPVHIMFSSIWGYLVGRAHLRAQPLGRVALKAVILAAVCHGIYDFIVIGLPAAVLPMSALVILVIWFWRMRLIADLHKNYHEESA